MRKFYPVNQLPDVLVLGAQTEHGVTELCFDCSVWLDIWPELELSIWVTTPVGDQYPAGTRMDGKILVWPVSAADTASVGKGRMEIMGVSEGKKKLSAIADTLITATSTDTSPNPPPAHEPWVEKVALDALDAKNAAGEAEEFARAAEEAKETAIEAANAVGDVIGAKNEALDEISDQKETSVKAVQNQQVESVKAVQDQQSASVMAVDQAKSAAVKALQDESTNQQIAVAAKGKETVDSIPANYTNLVGKVGQLSEDIENVTEPTRNLWVHGNVTVSPHSIYPIALPVGKTYVVHSKFETDDTVRNSSRIEFLNGNQERIPVLNHHGDEVNYIAMNRTTDAYWRFTPITDIAFVKLYASDTATNSKGFTTTWINLQIETGETATEYTKPFTAKDDVARDGIGKILKYYPIPKYVDYLETKAREINGMRDSSGLNGDSFVFITDYHVQNNSRNSVPMINYLLEHCGISFVCFGGDAQEYEKTLDEANYWNAEWKSDFSLIMEKLYCILGNHEFNTHYFLEDAETYPEESTTLTYSTAYNFFCKHQERNMVERDGFGDYVVDNKIQRLRYIFLGCPYDAQVPDSALAFVFEAMKNAPSGYGIVVFSHAGFRRQDGALDVADQIEKIGNAMYALNNRLVYSYTERVSKETKTVDFTNSGGEGICIICGHVHYDADSFADTTKTIPMIATTTDAWDEENPTYGGLERTKDTYLEQAFDVIRLDRTNRKLIFKRIGAGSDRAFNY